MLPDRDNPSEQQPGRAPGRCWSARSLRAPRWAWGSARWSGAPALLALAGGFVGVGVGFRLVYGRFKDL